MARGMVVGEEIRSQANTEAAREGYDRTFGPDRKPQRGHWVMDPVTKQLVSAEDYRTPELALDAPILSGRFYENQKTLEGEDIGSRRKYQDYCRRKGVTNSSDFPDSWYENKRKEFRENAHRERRETIERLVHTKFK